MLKVEGLTKSYGQEKILKGISFSLKKGETLVIMGPSGSGKSTAIRCLNLLTNPDGGKIFFNRANLLKLSKEKISQVRQQIGFVFQNFNLIAHLTVIQNVILPLIKTNLTPKKRIKRAKKALDWVNLKEKASAYPKNLSGGQKQRVGIARALVIDPRLILFDEPTASLDPILVREVLEKIEELTATKKRGIVLVTHEVNFALKVADRIMLLAEGKIVEKGTSSRIFTNPRSQTGKKYKKLLDYYR